MRMRVSAGVYFEEIDYSIYAPRLSKTIPAVIGIFEKGPTEPTFIPTAKQFVNTFGLPRPGSYSSYACLSYLEFGEQLWVKRLVGPNATKAFGEIPLGMKIEEESVGVSTGTEYIIKGDLNDVPIPGTVVFNIGNFELKDNAYGDILGSGLVNIPNFIDYDTGEFLFTFNSDAKPPLNSDVVLRYNTIQHEVNNALILTVPGAGTSFSGTLTYNNIVKGSLEIRAGEEILLDDGEGGFVKPDGTSATGTIDYDLGVWTVTFESSKDEGSQIRADYNYLTYREKIVGEGDNNRTGFIGSVNHNVSSNSVKIYWTDPHLVENENLASGDSSKKTFDGEFLNRRVKRGSVEITDGIETFTDEHGDGILTGDLGGTGSINYHLGLYNVTFMSAPATATNNIKGTYTFMTPVDDPIEVEDEVLSESPNGVLTEFTGTVEHLTVVPGSVEVKYVHTPVEEAVTVTLTDKNRNGALLDDGDTKRGEINYITGDVDLDLEHAPDDDTDILITYKYVDISNNIYDNGFGMLVGNIEVCDNVINYETGNFELAVIIPPDEGTTMTVSYVSMFKQNLGTGNSSKKVFSGKISNTPLVKNHVIVGYDDNNVFLKDNGEGLLISEHGNGTVDYDTGEIVAVFNVAPGAVPVLVSYLRTYATVEAISEGEWANGTKLRFFHDSFLGYGCNVWSPEQLASQTPIETWVDIDFTNELSTRYLPVSVASMLVNFDILNNESGTIPVLGAMIELQNGKSDIENITLGQVIDGLEVFSNPEEYDINLLLCPDYPGYKEITNKIIQVCETRYDCFGLTDPPRGLTVQQVTEWHNGTGRWANENSLNSSFAALYYPWVRIYDAFNDRYMFVPPSCRVIGVYAYSDSVSEPWFAPAGLNRGRLFNVLRTERPLTIGERDLLYGTPNSVNPIVNFPKDGVVVWGQKTLQRKPSALDRVNVRRLLIQVSKILATAVKYLVFEPNDEITWIQYRLITSPLLEDIKNRRGLYSFGIRCDSSTNTPFHIDNNEMVAEVWLQPTKSAEKIITRYIITPTGVELDQIVTSKK